MGGHGLIDLWRIQLERIRLRQKVGLISFFEGLAVEARHEIAAAEPGSALPSPTRGLRIMPLDQPSQEPGPSSTARGQRALFSATGENRDWA